MRIDPYWQIYALGMTGGIFLSNCFVKVPDWLMFIGIVVTVAHIASMITRWIFDREESDEAESGTGPE
ncbi:hypothetical protein SEA_LUCKYLEO_82 [Gordonia phage LuckyLeo]|nr:hypothetical protein SEA_LUCKYLEO_82 [Gordonia phage LuckyLeo]